MNKSDFISDAVALDLGKSGVKVAETLEMQIGDEWWRLINSSEPLTIKGFVKRIERGVDIEEGEMDISPISTTFETVGGGTVKDQEGNTRSLIVRVKQEGGSDLIRLIVMCRDTYDTENIATIRAFMYQEDGTIEKTYTEYTISASTLSSGPSVAFWDYVNQRAILAFNGGASSSNNKVLYADATGSSVIALGNLSFTNTVSTEVKTFLEAPEKIYSLFRSADSITVNATTPTEGQTATALAIAVCNPSGATSVAVASNYRNKEAFLFYSRTHESAGVAWVDRTNGRLYYALESETWATAHELSSAFSGDTLNYFGNMVLKGDDGGEYYVAGRSNYSTGNFTKPAGFSFPANLAVMGVSASVSGYARIFGRIGSVLYVYLVNLSTMTILSEKSYDIGVTIDANFQPVKIAGSATRELYYLNYCATNLTKTVIRAVLVNIDIATDNILWVWGYGTTGWLDTTAWASLNGASGYNQAIIRKYRTDIGFITLCANLDYWQRVSARFIPSDQVISCDSVVEMQTLIRGCPLKQSSTTGSYIKAGMRSVQAQNALTWGETVDTFFFADYQNDTRATYPLVIHFDKTTKAFVANYNGPTSGGGSALKQMCGMSYSDEYDGYMYNTPDGTQENIMAVDTRTNYLRKFSPSLSLLGSYLLFSSPELWSRYTNYVISGKNDVSHFYANNVASPSLLCYIVKFWAGGCSVYLKILPLSHNAFRVWVSEKENLALIISDCIDGEIAYTQYNAHEGSYKKALAIKATDFDETYSIDLGETPLSGEHSASPSGSWMFSRDFANNVVLTSTGASFTDYMGGEAPTDGGSTIYVYEDLNYIPYPFAREGIKVELSNISKTTKVTIPETQTDLIRTMIASGTDFRGSRCILRRLFPDHTEEGSDIILLDGYIQDWSYSPDKKGVVFTVSKTLIDVGATFPKRLMNMGCSHVFKGVRCGYLGADGICTKTKTDCIAKQAVANFGGFPWVAARQRRIMWR